MLQIRTVLVATDRSVCAERAYAPAAALAARHGARLRVVHVAEPGARREPLHVTSADVSDDLRLPSKPEPAGGPVEVEEVAGTHASPALDLLDLARSDDVDVIVMGTHGRLGFGHVFLGRVTEQVVRLADRPVLTVPCDETHEGGPVVAAVDFSEGSRVALLHARELADELGAPLHVLHVVEWPDEPPPYLFGLEVLALPDVVARARVELGSFAAPAGPGAVTEVRAHGGGLAAFGVADYAREVGASLVVLSTHGRKGLRRVMMGSVAERIVRTAPCPVFTVHPDGRSLLPASVEAVAETAELPAATP